MITVNIDVSDGLANGVCGTVVAIDHTGDDVHTILVNFDSDRVGREAIPISQYKQVYPGAVPIKRQEVQFYAGRGRQSVQAKRIQFPLSLAWGCTIHKVQGKTLDTIVVSMKGRSRFMPGQAYVALSRVKSLQGLFLLGFDASVIRINPLVQEEMDRLHKSPSPTYEVPSFMRNSGGCLKIGLLNIRSYLEHMEDMKADPVVPFIDVFCFVETFLRDGQCINEGAQIIPSMTYFRAERSSSSNVGKGGIMIMASQELSPVSVNPCVTGIEYTSVSVTKCETQVNIVTIYRSPLMSSPLFTQRLHVLLESLDKTVLTVILGDFNYDLLDSPEHNILQMMCSHGFHQYVTRPTTDYGSLLDHAYVNKEPRMDVDIVDIYYSDHDMVCVTLYL